MNKELQDQLTAAKKELKALQSDLPKIQALLESRTQEHLELKASKQADFEAITDARSKVHNLTDLLATHQAELADQAALVSAIEQQIVRDEQLTELAAIADDYAGELDTLERDFADTMTQVHAAITPLLEKRKRITRLYRDISGSASHLGIKHPAHDQQTAEDVQTLIDELSAYTENAKAIMKAPDRRKYADTITVDLPGEYRALKRKVVPNRHVSQPLLIDVAFEAISQLSSHILETA